MLRMTAGWSIASYLSHYVRGYVPANKIKAGRVTRRNVDET